MFNVFRTLTNAKAGFRNSIKFPRPVCTSVNGRFFSTSLLHEKNADVIFEKFINGKLTSLVDEKGVSAEALYELAKHEGTISLRGLERMWRIKLLYTQDISLKPEMQQQLFTQAQGILSYLM